MGSRSGRTCLAVCGVSALILLRAGRRQTPARRWTPSLSYCHRLRLRRYFPRCAAGELSFLSPRRERKGDTRRGRKSKSARVGPGISSRVPPRAAEYKQKKTIGQCPGAAQSTVHPGIVHPPQCPCEEDSVPPAVADRWSVARPLRPQLQPVAAAHDTPNRRQSTHRSTLWSGGAIAGPCRDATFPRLAERHNKVHVQYSTGGCTHLAKRGARCTERTVRVVPLLVVARLASYPPSTRKRMGGVVIATGE